MSKVKIPKTSVSIDMTPMVDMAFLLVTFFILTTQFRPDEPVQVSTPSSTSTSNPPEHGKVIITIAPDGRVFFDLDNQLFRSNLIQKMAESYGMTVNQDEINAFATGGSIGVPMKQMKDYLDTPASDRKDYVQTGIPVDTTEYLSNELSVWLVNARIAGNNPMILIKGDSKANYPNVKNVFTTLAKKKCSSFWINN